MSEIERKIQREYNRVNYAKNREQRRLEHEAQRAVVEWAAWNERKYPELKLLYHCPNGELRDKATAAKLKEAGVKAGIPDLHLPVSRGGAVSLYIEMKTATGSLSTRQVEVIQWLRDENNDVKVCRSTKDAIEVIETYLRGKKWNQRDLLDWIAAKHCKSGGTQQSTTVTENL